MDEERINRRDFLAAAKGLVIGTGVGLGLGKLEANSESYLRSPIEAKKPVVSDEEAEIEHGRRMVRPVGYPEEPVIEERPADVPAMTGSEARTIAEGAASGALTGAMAGAAVRLLGRRNDQEKGR